MKKLFPINQFAGLLVLALLVHPVADGQCLLNGGKPPTVTHVEAAVLNGYASLSGIPEFTNPSTPLKKYKRATAGGSGLLECRYAGTTCTGAFQYSTGNSVDGAIVYGPSVDAGGNLVVTNTIVYHGYDFGSSCAHGTEIETSAFGLFFSWYHEYLPGKSATSTLLRWTWPNTCAETFGSSIITSGEVTLALSEEDTEADAEKRAETAWTAANGNKSWDDKSRFSTTILPLGPAYRESHTSGSGFAWYYRKVRYKAKFDIECAGEYDVVITYATSPRGSSTMPASHDTQIVRKEMDAGEHAIEGEIRILQPDTNYTVENIEIRKPCATLSPGAPDFQVSSVHAELSLGRGLRQESAGFLSLKADTITSALYAPAALVAATADSGAETIRDGSGALRQLKAPQTLADIVTLNSSSYEVRFYALGDVGAQDAGTKIYSVSGTPFVTYKFENPDTGQSTRLRITETRGSNTRVSEYAYDAGTTSWSLSKGSGLRQETLALAVVSGDSVRTTTVRDASNNVVSKTKRTYHTYGWGEEIISEVLYPDGAALTTTSEFYGSSGGDGDNYGHLKQRTNPDGSWERHTWNASGQPLKTIRPFGDAISTAADNLCRVTQNTYSTLADADGDGAAEQLVTTVESALGQETSRSYRVDWSKTVTLGGDVCQRRTDIHCVAAGAAWNASANLVTETLTYHVDPFFGRDRRVVRPDGTATLTTYAVDSSGVLTTTSKQGQPNGTLDDVVSGTRTVTFTSAKGQVTGESVTDIASNLTLTSWTATQFDTLGRVTRLDYPDSTYETRDYACCGLSSSRDRSGLVTSYQYDDLGRQTDVSRNGLTSHTTYDADGRVKTVSRIGSDNSSITQETNTYDLAGRLTERRDALNRLTATNEVFDSGTGHTTRTTTNPDTSTGIEVRARDGSVLSVSGTAVAPRNYEYGVDTDGLYTKTILVGPSGATTEWSKTWTDFAGRTYKTVLADNATTQSYFNAVGQMIRQVDPDGVTTLFAYNARGEQETVAVDLNANNAIDYNGTDRVTRTVSDVAAHSGVNVQRSTTSVWETDNQDTSTTVSISEQGGDGIHSWQTVRGLTNSTVTTVDGSGGRTVTATAPDGVKTIQTFTGDRLTSTTVKTAADVQLSIVSYGADAHGRLGSATDARTGTTTYIYFDDDQIHTVTTPDPAPARSGDGYDPQTTTYAYDNAGRVSDVTQPDGGVVHTTYWSTGAVKRTWGSRTYPSEYTYDPQGRVKTLTTWQNFSGDSCQAVTTWNYDAVRGWLNNKRYADNTGPTYTYKPSGRLLTRVWARTPAITCTYGYNAAGDLTGMDYSDVTPDVTMAFDRAGRPKSMTDAAGTRTLGYHSSGQLEDEAYTSGILVGFTLDRSFDSLARLSGLTVGSVYAVSYGYDAASRLDTVTAGTNTATYGYASNSFLVESLTFKQGGTTRLTTTKAYDNLNRLASITHTPSVSAAISVAYTYNSANQRTKAVRETSAYWNYGYDPLGQVTSGKKFTAADAAVPGHDFAWTYDDIGNRKTAVANGSTSTYSATSLNQYSTRTVPGVIEVLGEAQTDATVTTTYPATGGTIAATTRQGSLFYKQLTANNSSGAQNPSVKITGVKNLVGANGEDAVTEITKTAYVAQTPEGYTHDADGNLTDDARWHYTWDGENRLSAMETSTAAISAGVAKQKLEFAYDGQSRRFSKKVYSWSGGVWVLASHTLFLFDGWNMVAELNALSSNAVIRTHVWGTDLSGAMQGAGGVGGLLFMNAPALSSPLHAACFDGNGNTIGLVDMTTGAKSATYEYNAFGETIQSDGVAAAANHFRFSTKYQDDETGLIYFSQRFYDPHPGRFLSRDPIEENGGANLYGFVANDPLNTIDALGLDFIAVGKRGAKVILGIQSHMSIEYYEQKCPKAKKGLQFTPADLGHGDLADAKRTAAFELIPELWHYKHAKYTPAIPATKFTPAIPSIKVLVPIGVSFIQSSSTAEHMVVIHTDTSDAEDSAKKWAIIANAANSYAYAEHSAVGSPVVNWPNSHYELPPGNNSNTFIYEMAASIGESAAVFSDTPGNSAAVPVTGAGEAPVYVP